MFKCCFLISVVLGFAACTQSEFTDVDDTQLPIEHSRAVFSSSNEFFKTYNKLAQMTPEEQDKWIESQNFVSIVNLEEKGDSVLIEGPRAFKTFFNEDLKFQIGDSVIWYNNGDLLVVSIDGNSQFDKSEGTYPVFAKSEYKAVGEDIPQTRFDHGCDFRGNHILQNFEYGGWGYRYIAELSAHTIRGFDSKIASLYLSLRMDYRGLPNGKWVASNAGRRYTHDLVGKVYFTNGSHSTLIGGSFQATSLKSDRWFEDGSYVLEPLYVSGTVECCLKTVQSAPLSYDRWFIQEIRGAVYQQLEGVPSTKLYVPTNNGVIWQ